MKKFILIIVAAIMMAGCLSACGSGNGGTAMAKDKIQIVTTIFPEYDWVMNVLGAASDDVEVTMLLDNGVDLHSYQPTANDIMKISTCDLFIYVGGESDEWVEDALKEAINKDMVVINLLDVLGDSVKEEEVVEGMQGEEEEEEEGEGEEEVEYDEHVWLSLKNAAVLVKSISEALQKIDPDNTEIYEKNASAYIEKLNSLDEKYKSAVSGGSTDTLLFGDRFPFRYLVDDYGLKYYAAFVGCSAETEASFETITFLSEKVDELNLNAVMTIEGNDHRIAETIVQNTETKDQKILTMDSMQSTTAKDVEGGVSYISIMESNLSVLKEALGSIDAVSLQEPDFLYEEDPESGFEEEPVLTAGTEGVDVDLTRLSSTVVYSEVYHMMVSPEDYIGKIVKMNGMYVVYHDEASDKNYHSCIVSDATACCSQGIEFILTDDYKYPDDYPEETEDICVVGEFDTYKEADYTFCTLKNARLESVDS